MEKTIKIEEGWSIRLPQDIVEALKLEPGDNVNFEIVEPGVISMEKA